MKICNALVQFIRPITTKFCTRHNSNTCCDVCKILLWSVCHFLNHSNANFDRISNSIKTLLVGWEPGVVVTKALSGKFFSFATSTWYFPWITFLIVSWKKIFVFWLNFHQVCSWVSLWPSDTIWRQRTGLTLVQVMACCLTATSHYLNQCWLIISKVQWHSSDGNFTRDTYFINH